MGLLTPFSYSEKQQPWWTWALRQTSFYLYLREGLGPPAPEDPTVFLLRPSESLFVHLCNGYLLSAAYLLHTVQGIGNRAVDRQVF